MRGPWLKRVVLFVLTNVAVLAVFGVVLNLIGADRFIAQWGLDVPRLLVFSAVYGFGGSIVSLLISKAVAKWTTGARVIEQPADATELWLVETVRRFAERAGIGMPQVAIYDSPEMNAFATGARRDSALVAVSTGLLQRMRREEVEAVLGHEVAHIANGDMVTMTLLQGVLNTFVIFLSRVIAYAADRLLSRSSDDEAPSSGPAYFLVSMVAQLALGVLASLIVAAFSRRREFRADAGSAELGGAGPMIAALTRLKGAQDEAAGLPGALNAFGIRSGHGVLALFTTHPPLEARIEALRERAAGGVRTYARA